MDNRILKDIQPSEVFKYFEDVTRIPRCSGEEKEISDYLVAFAEEHEFEWYRDDLYNVLIRKPASPGFENKDTIILQAHSDMVCVKRENYDFDFKTCPIEIEVEGDLIISKNTSLGADDGIGLALGLAVLESNEISHPPIEFLCTTDEECGMGGAEAFDVSLLKGRTIINLDSDEEGVFPVGCAGGPVVSINLPIKRTSVDNGNKFLLIQVGGLKGGHSGEDIDKGRGNAIKLLSRILVSFQQSAAFCLCHIEGGQKYNAIPRDAQAIIAIKEEDVEKVENIVKQENVNFKNEYHVDDAEVYAKMTTLHDYENSMIEQEYADNIIDFLYLSDSGIIRMDQDFDDFVESSVSLGVVKSDNENVLFETMTRSSKESVYMNLYNKIERLAKKIGAKTEVLSNCPEWEYNPSSKIKNTFQNVYKQMYGKNPEFIILHAGLECGIFNKNLKKINPDDTVDLISAGPDVRDLHAPGENISISSTQKFWEFFVKVLESL